MFQAPISDQPKSADKTTISLGSIFSNKAKSTEIFSKAPNFYTCELVGGVKEAECNQLFIKAKELRDLQSVK